MPSSRRTARFRGALGFRAWFEEFCGFAGPLGGTKETNIVCNNNDDDVVDDDDELATD